MNKQTRRPQDQFRKILDSILRVGYALLLLLIIWTVWGEIRGLLVGPGGLFTFNIFGLAGLMLVSALIVNGMLIPALFLGVIGKPLNRNLRVGANVVLIFVLIVALFISYGWVRDIMGEHCTGFSLEVAARASCVGNQMLLSTLFLFDPLVYFSSLGVVGWNLGRGWYSYLKGRGLLK